jgi:hypothetical protein
LRHQAGARELEQAAAAAPGRHRHLATAVADPVLAALARRGLQPRPAPVDLPFDPELAGEAAERLAGSLRHYAFRLFLRGAIARPGGFAPEQATRYVSPERAEALAEELLALGLAARVGPRRLRLKRGAHSFGGALEWYLAHELRVRLGFAVATGLKLGVRGVGGDLDLVAVADGRLACLELKSSPPRNLELGEVEAFLARLAALRPDVALFVIDTALRLEDKVVPLLVEALARRSGALVPRRLAAGVFGFTPHLFAVNAQGDLFRNVARALAFGLRALAPSPP